MKTIPKNGAVFERADGTLEWTELKRVPPSESRFKGRTIVPSPKLRREIERIQRELRRRGRRGKDA